MWNFRKVVALPVYRCAQRGRSVPRVTVNASLMFFWLLVYSAGVRDGLSVAECSGPHRSG